MCASMVDQMGVMAYNAFINCIACNSCYTTCQGAMAGSGCMGTPTEDATCDVGTPGMTGCGACAMCTEKAGGSCNAVLTACKGNPQCVDLAQNLYNTCGMLPM
jgi:hypothetical protein